ncbi:MAG: hypothetical protein AAF437_04110 [Pseudomonadota bacterium]
MSKLEARLKALEKRITPRVRRVDTILYHAIAPSPDGPVDQGAFAAWIIKGPGAGARLERNDAEKEEDFLARIEAVKMGNVHPIDARKLAPSQLETNN